MMSRAGSANANSGACQPMAEALTATTIIDAFVAQNSLIGAVATNLDDQERELRGGLVATQLLGLAMTRYVWRLEPIASPPDEEIVACVAPTLQRYLTGVLRPQH